MRNKRLIIAITGAVLCGMLAVMLVTRYLSNVQAYTKDLGNVVVANTEIPLGAKIVPEQLSLASIPNGSTPEGAFRKIEEVAGRVAQADRDWVLIDVREQDEYRAGHLPGAIGCGRGILEDHIADLAVLFLISLRVTVHPGELGFGETRVIDRLVAATEHEARCQTHERHCTLVVREHRKPHTLLFEERKAYFGRTHFAQACSVTRRRRRSERRVNFGIVLSLILGARLAGIGSKPFRRQLQRQQDKGSRP